MSQGLDFGYYLYTADNGTTKYSVRLATSTGGNADLGFEAMDSTKPVLPQGYKMRYAMLLDPTTGNRRKRPVGKVTSDIWTGVEDTISMDILGVDAPVDFDVTLRVGERASKAHAVYNL